MCLNWGLSLKKGFVLNSLNNRETVGREEGYFAKSLTESYKGKNLLNPVDLEEHVTLQTVVIKTHPDDTSNIYGGYLF